MHRQGYLLACVLVFAMLGTLIPTSPIHSYSVAKDRTAPEAVQDSPSALFVENVGQFGDGARFRMLGSAGAILWLSDDALWLTMIEPPVEAEPDAPGYAPSAYESGHGVHLKLTFVGAQRAEIVPFGRVSTRISYITGNDPAGWRQEVPAWRGVRYVGLYPGIDLELMGGAGGIVQRLIIHPGSRPQAVWLKVDGADALTVGNSVLDLDTPLGHMSLPLFQAVDPEGKSLDLTDFAPQVKGNVVRSPFNSLSDLSPTQQVTGGSSDLLYSTFLGGSGWEYSGGTPTWDPASHLLIMAGSTPSPEFPITPGTFDPSHNGGQDAFVVKMDPAGNGETDLVSATFVGGSAHDWGQHIAVDAAGFIYVTGRTESADYPISIGAYDPSYNGECDAFISKLTPDASALVYSTYLGGTGCDAANRLVVDNDGSAYLVGETTSGDFPATLGAYATSINGLYDAFVAKVSSDGASLVYATYLGGSSYDSATDIAVNAAGQVYVTGRADSNNFPTTPDAFDPGYNGFVETYVAKLNTSGTDLIYSTYLGGSDYDWPSGIVLDADGNAYVVGTTRSGDFPTTPGAFDTMCGAGDFCNTHMDVFVVKLNAAGNGLVYSTFVGGEMRDDGGDIAVDGLGQVYVTGSTESGYFPTTAGAFDTNISSYSDAFAIKLNSLGSSLRYGTYLGGGSTEGGVGITFGDAGSVYVIGDTRSGNFPTTAGAFNTILNGEQDIFLSKLALGACYDGSCVSGTILDEWDMPLPGVLLDDGQGRMAQSGLDGIYALLNLPAGTEVITPTRTGYTLLPATRTTNVPPHALDQNFTALHDGGGWSAGMDGVDDTINVPDSPSLHLGTAATVEVLVYLFAVPSTPSQIIFDKWADGQEDKSLSIDGGYVYFYLHGIFSDYHALKSNQTLLPNRWYHIAGSYDGTQARLYINGVEDNSKEASGDIADSAAPLYIGGIHRAEGDFAPIYGLVDELRIWSIGRSQSEIQSTMGEALSGTEPGLVAYWRLNEGTGQIAADLTSNHNNAQWGNSSGSDAQDPRWDSGELYSPCAEDTICGIVRDEERHPVGSVTISAGAAGTITTDAFGFFFLPDLEPGPYVITPTLAGYLFAPPTRTVTLPFQSPPQDFAAIDLGSDIATLVESSREQILAVAAMTGQVSYVADYFLDKISEDTLSGALDVFLDLISLGSVNWNLVGRGLNHITTFGYQAALHASWRSWADPRVTKHWYKPLYDAIYNDRRLIFDKVAWAGLKYYALEASQSATLEISKDLVGDWVHDQFVPGPGTPFWDQMGGPAIELGGGYRSELVREQNALMAQWAGLPLAATKVEAYRADMQARQEANTFLVSQLGVQRDLIRQSYEDSLADDIQWWKFWGDQLRRWATIGGAALMFDGPGFYVASVAWSSYDLIYDTMNAVNTLHRDAKMMDQAAQFLTGRSLTVYTQIALNTMAEINLIRAGDLPQIAGGDLVMETMRSYGMLFEEPLTFWAEERSELVLTISNTSSYSVTFMPTATYVADGLVRSQEGQFLDLGPHQQGNALLRFKTLETGASPTYGSIVDLLVLGATETGIYATLSAHLSWEPIPISTGLNQARSTAAGIDEVGLDTLSILPVPLSSVVATRPGSVDYQVAIAVMNPFSITVSAVVTQPVPAPFVTVDNGGGVASGSALVWTGIISPDDSLEAYPILGWNGTVGQTALLPGAVVSFAYPGNGEHGEFAAADKIVEAAWPLKVSTDLPLTWIENTSVTLSVTLTNLYESTNIQGVFTGTISTVEGAPLYAITVPISITAQTGQIINLAAPIDPIQDYAVLTGEIALGSIHKEVFLEVAGIYTPASADFVSSSMLGGAPFTVVFTNTSTGDYLINEWSFGDGVTSTEQMASHTFIHTGTYTVNLAIDGPAGADTHSQSIRVVQVVPFALSLQPGWNLVSWPLVSLTRNLTETLSPWSDTVDAALIYDAMDTVDPWKHWPDDLTQVDEKMGVWLHATEPVTLTLKGWRPEEASIPLQVGWNLVGYPSQTAQTVAGALSSIEGCYTVVRTFDAADLADPWKWYNVDVPVYTNDLTIMEPGHAYWIYAEKVCTLIVAP